MKTECLKCDGTGVIPNPAFDYDELGNPTTEIEEIECPYCAGTGKINEDDFIILLLADLDIEITLKVKKRTPQQ